MNKRKTQMYSRASLTFRPTKSKAKAKGTIRITKNKTTITKYKK